MSNFIGIILILLGLVGCGYFGYSVVTELIERKRKGKGGKK